MNVQRLLLWMATAVVAALLSGCSGGTSSLEALLSEADYLASYGQPMRAVALLDSVAPSFADVPQSLAMRYAVLYIKAHDKAFLPLPPPDSLVADIVKYYDAHPQSDLLHRAEGYYYAGRTFSETGDALQALHYFQRVEDEANDSNWPAELNSLLGKVYAQIGYIDIKYHIYDLSEEYFRKSYECESSVPEPDTAALIYSYADIAYALRRQRRFGEALSYQQSSIELACCYGDTQLVGNANWELGLILLDSGKCEQAWEHIHPYSEHCLPRHRRPMDVTLAHYYFDTGNYDSAWHYCRRIQEDNTIGAKESASQAMVHMALAQGNQALADDCFRLYQQQSDTLGKMLDFEAIRLTQASHTYRLRERENEILTLRNQTLRRHRTYYLSGLLSALLLLGVACVHAVRGVRELKRQKAETRRILSRIGAAQQVDPKADIPVVNLGQTGGETGISGAPAGEDTEATSVGGEDNAEALRRREEDLRRARYEQFCHTFFSSPVGKTLEERIDRQKCLTIGEIRAIEQEFEQYQPEFLRTLKSIHRFNQTEWLITLLVRLGIKPSDIAILSSKSKEAVSAARRRLSQKVLSHDKPSPGAWDDFVSRL